MFQSSMTTHKVERELYLNRAAETSVYSGIKSTSGWWRDCDRGLVWNGCIYLANKHNHLILASSSYQHWDTKLNTFQHIDTSLHILVLESSVNPLCGCVTKQPLVIKPFICPSDTFSMLLFFPRKMFFDESNPAAYTCDVKGKLYSHIILKANLDIVLCTVCVSELSLLLLLELYQLLQN